VTRAVVFGYSEVGTRCLRVLLDHGIEVATVFTHEDDPGESHWYGSVAETARAGGVPVVMPENPNEARWVGEVARLKPDFIFSFYYRHMLSDELLATARRGALNMHGSLLPRYRGRAPVNWALVHGETETGASLHYMATKPDAGPMVGQERVAIGINDTALEVSMRVAEAAERLLGRCLPALVAGRAVATPLDLSQGSYFGRRRPADGEVSWEWPALQIHNLVRAVAPPFPGAFGMWGTRTFRLLGSKYFGEAARFPQLAPCLYVDELALRLDCVDGRRLTLTSVELDGEALLPERFTSRCGTNVLLLRSATNRKQIP